MTTKRTKQLKAAHPKPNAGAALLDETVSLPGLGFNIPVRVAEAGLRPAETAADQAGFEPALDFLESMSTQTGGPSAKELIRADRDGRGR